MVSVQQSLFSSLDNNFHFSASSCWGKKEKRGYMRCRAGVERAGFVGDRLFFLTLTSASKERGLNCLTKDWNLLVQRVRRELRFKFEFFKVITNEGFGVIHALFRTGKTDFCWGNDGIHAYFSTLWSELHGAPVVWCTLCYKVRGSFKSLIRYLVAQYVMKQGFLHLGYSGGWCFRGFVKVFYYLLAKHGFQVGLDCWRNVLMSVFDKVVWNSSFDMIIGV